MAASSASFKALLRCHLLKEAYLPIPETPNIPYPALSFSILLIIANMIYCVYYLLTVPLPLSVSAMKIFFLSPLFTDVSIMSRIAPEIVTQ